MSYHRSILKGMHKRGMYELTQDGTIHSNAYWTGFVDALNIALTIIPDDCSEMATKRLRDSFDADDGPRSTEQGEQSG